MRLSKFVQENGSIGNLSSKIEPDNRDKKRGLGAGRHTSEAECSKEAGQVCGEKANWDEKRRREWGASR